MRFHYYGEPYQPGYAAPYGFGYYGEPVGAYYGAGPGFAGYGLAAPYYGQVDPGYGHAEPGYGYGVPGYGELEPVGYYAEETPVGYYGEDPYAPVGEYETVAGYGEMPEMVGYGNDYGYGYAGCGYGDPYGESDSFAEEYPGVSDYGEPEIAGYVRDVPPAFNAGCPMPTNAGLGENESFAGYKQPAEVSPSCQQFTPQSGPESSLADTLRPLW